MKSFLALIKREILEHRSLWKVPAIMFGLAVLVKLSTMFGNLEVSLNVPSQFEIDKAVDSIVTSATMKAVNLMNSLIMMVMVLVAIFYSLSALFNERQDQSVLFWRSLPISDTQTVLSKLAIALVLVPLILLVSQVLVAIVFLGSSGIEFFIGHIADRAQSLIKVLCWSILPVVAWCLLCSQIAKSSPFLLAIVAPIVVWLVDRLFLSGAISKTVVINRLTGVKEYTPTLLIIGVVFSALCLAVTIARRGERV